MIYALRLSSTLQVLSYLITSKNYTNKTLYKVDMRTVADIHGQVTRQDAC